MSEAQRLVWYLRSEIERKGIDATDLCLQVYDAHVVSGKNGLYDDQIVVFDGPNKERRVVWEGLEQTQKKNS